MTWLWLSLMTALAAASQDAWIKRYFSDLTPYEMTAIPILYSIPFFSLFLPFVTVPPLDAVFFGCVLVALPINAFAIVLYMKAIKTSPLSLTIPYLAFTPAFMILTGGLILGELPNQWGALGIVVTCAGEYVLNLDAGRGRILDPLSAIFRETGSWIMLIVAFLFSFAAVIGKLGIEHSSPMFFTCSFFLVFSVVMSGLLMGTGRARLPLLARYRWKGLTVGGILFVHAVLHGFAISMAKAAYMIAIKRLSILFSVLLGGILFHEGAIRIRFTGAVLMVSGAAIIVVKGI